MTESVSFRYYQAIKLHFMKSSKYDFVKYNGNTKVSRNFSDYKKYNWVFSNIDKTIPKPDVLNFVLANLLPHVHGQISPLMLSKPDRNAVFEDRMKMLNRLPLTVEADLKNGLNGGSLKDIIMPQNNNYPLIYQMVNDNKLSLMTFCVIDKALNFTQYFNINDLNDELYWRNKAWFYHKNSAFVYYDNNKIQDVLHKFLVI